MARRTISDLMNHVLNQGINRDLTDQYGDETAPIKYPDEMGNQDETRRLAEGDFSTSNADKDAGGSEVQSNGDNSPAGAENSPENLARPVPVMSPAILPSFHGVPQSYLDDTEEQNPGFSFSDMSPSSSQPSPSSSSSAPASDLKPDRNLNPILAQAGTNAGLDVGSSRYHVSRKRQLLEGIARAVQSWATPQGQAALYNGGLPAALAVVASGAASGAIRKNKLGEEELGKDIQDKSAQAKAQSEIQFKQAQAAKDVGEADWYSRGRAQAAQDRETTRRMDIQSRAETAAGQTAAKVTMASDAAKVKAGLVKNVNYTADSDGDVYRNITRNDNSLDTELVTIKGADGSTRPLKKAEAVQANMRLQLGQANLTERTRHDQAEESIQANPPTSQTSSVSTPTPLKTKDQISGEKFNGAPYASLSRAKQQMVDDEFNKPSNIQYQRSSQTTKSRGVQRVPNTSVRDSISPQHPLRAPDGTILNSPEDYDNWKQKNRKQ